MLPVRTLLGLGGVLLLGSCAVVPEPGPEVTVVPGVGKNLAAFEQDDVICRQHAASHAGPAVRAGAVPDPIGYLQCMAGRGNVVGPRAAGDAEAGGGYPYGYPYGYFWGYPFGYPYDYGYPYGYPFAYGYPVTYPYGFYGAGGVAVFGGHHGHGGRAVLGRGGNGGGRSGRGGGGGKGR